MGIETSIAGMQIPIVMNFFGAAIGRLIKQTTDRSSSLAGVLCGKVFTVASVIYKPISQLVIFTPKS